MPIVPPEGPSPFDHLRRPRPDGSEYWSARELMPLLGYTKWENFRDAVREAREVVAAEQGVLVADQAFSWKREKGTGGRSREDCHLARGACYVTAMRGDSRKAEIRAALLYFAEKTREAEVRAQSPALPQDYEDALVHLLAKVRENKQLETRVAELEPSAQAWDVLASAEGDFSLRDAAHILNRDRGISTGQNRLLRSIREFDMVDRNGVPYAKHSAHLVERPTSYNHPRTGEPVLSKQLRVTVQGLRYLHRRLGGEGPLQLPMRDAG